MRHHKEFRRDGQRNVDKMTGPEIARQSAAHIQRNHAKPGRNYLGDRISPDAGAMPAPGGSMPMGGMGGGGAPMGGGGAPDDTLGGL